MKKIFLVGFVFVLLGCRTTTGDSHFFYHPATSPEQMQSDKAKCEIHARRSARVSGAGSILLTEIIRQGKVEELSELCMKSLGYRLIEKHNAPKSF